MNVLRTSSAMVALNATDEMPAGTRLGTSPVTALERQGKMLEMHEYLRREKLLLGLNCDVLRI